MWVKVIIIIAFIGILFSLGSGLFFLVHDRGKSKRTATALTWRVGLSVGLFVLLMLLAALGYIKPHGLLPAQPAKQTMLE